MQSCLCHEAELERLTKQGEGRVTHQGAIAYKRYEVKEERVTLGAKHGAELSPKDSDPISQVRKCSRNSQTRQGQLQSTLKALRKDLIEAQTHNDRAAQAHLLTRIGIAHCQLGEYAWGIKCLEQALQIARAIENGAIVSIALYYLGAAYRQTEQVHKALRAYLQALAIFQNIGDEHRIANILNHLGEIYKSLGHLEQAQKSSHQALKMFHELGDLPEGEGAALQNLGEVYWQLGRPRQALAFFEQALAIYRKVRDPQSEAMVLESLGTVYVSLNQEQRSLNLYHQALEIRQRISKPPIGDGYTLRTWEARSLDYIGAVHYKLGNYPRALWYHLQALDILQTIHQTSVCMTFLYDISSSERFLQHVKIVYERLDLHAQGVKCYQQALEIVRIFGYRATEEAIQNYLNQEESVSTDCS